LLEAWYYEMKMKLSWYWMVLRDVVAAELTAALAVGEDCEEWR
jgi:hypothetical protein